MESKQHRGGVRHAIGSTGCRPEEYEGPAGAQLWSRLVSYLSPAESGRSGGDHRHSFEVDGALRRPLQSFRMNMRALIVDDEALARAALSRLLKQDGGITIIGECGDGKSAVRSIR